MSKFDKDPNRSSRQVSLEFECCEPRRLLAGNVTVVENGNLYIRGDQLNNQIQIAANELGQIEVTGLNGTTINRGARPVVVQGSYSLDGFRGRDTGFDGGLRVHMGPGNDNIHVRGAEFSAFSNILGGTGHDTVEMVADTFRNGLFMNTYDGNDDVSIANSRFYGDLHVETLDGDDTLTVYNSRTRGNTYLVGGNHGDHIVLDTVRLDGNRHLLLSQSGNDQIQVRGNRVGENGLRVHSGEGRDQVFAEMNLADGSSGYVHINGEQGFDTLKMSGDKSMLDQAIVFGFESDGELAYDNSVDDFGGLNATIPAWFHTANLNFREAADVQVSETQTISQITWTGSYGGDLNIEFPEAYETDDFTIEIYEGTSEIPLGDPVASFNVGNDVNRTDTGTTVGPLGQKKIYSYSADIDVTLEAGKVYWISIYGAVQDDVRAGSVGGDFVTFEWGIRSLLGTFGTEVEDNPSVYTYGDRTIANPGWFDNYGGIHDFQLWS